MNFLKNILRGTARPAVTRPVPMVPAAKHPARSQAVEVLELRVQQSIRRSPVVRVEDEPYQSPLMPVGRMRQAEENEAAQLKRELVMERMRVKELREQLEEAQKNRSTQALVGMLEGASAEAKCMELQAELREVRQALAAVKLFLDQLGAEYEGLEDYQVCEWVEKTVFPGLTKALGRRVG